MKILVFAKNRQTRDGRAFTAYVSKMTKRDGSEIVAGVKFRQECGAPSADVCPCYIEFDKIDANMTERTHEIVDEETGEVREATQRTLWVSKWTLSDEKYVDTSLDEFDD